MRKSRSAALTGSVSEDRPPSGPVASTISWSWRRNAATRGRHAALSGRRRAVEGRTADVSSEGQQARHQRSAARVCAGPAVRAVTAPDGTPIPGPRCAWNGRRHGRRQDRRWVTAWSPEQIAQPAPDRLPDDESMRISHEAIYQALYVQGRGGLAPRADRRLRTGRALRGARARTRRRGRVHHPGSDDQRTTSRSR